MGLEDRNERLKREKKGSSKKLPGLKKGIVQTHGIAGFCKGTSEPTLGDRT